MTASSSAPAAPRHPPRGAVARRLLNEAVRPYAWQLVLAAISTVIVAAMTATSAWLMDPVVNKVFIDRDHGMLWLIGAAVAGTFVLKSAAAYIQDSLLGYVGQKIIADIQRKLYRHLIHHDMALFQSRPSGALVSHFTYDTNAMRNTVSGALVGIGRDGLSILFLVGVMVYQEWLLSLIILVIAPLSVIQVRSLSRRMRRVSTSIQNNMGVMTATLTQSFQGIRVIKSFGMEERECNRFDQVVGDLFRLNFRAARVSAISQPVVDTVSGIAIAAVIVYGGFRVIDGHTTAGTFFSFITAVLMAYQPLRSLSKVAPLIQEGLSAAERVFALLDQAPALTDRPDAATLPRLAGEVRFDAVGFAYDGDTAALDGASFTAAAGKVTALVGPSGAGKSTVFNLIPRFYDPRSGRVLINGQDIRTVSRPSLRDAIAVVSQEVILFDDTVINNIRYGRPEATDQEVWAAARAAAADDFIRALPQGYDTVVGEFGLRLSGGQRQRLAIARAILKDAPILLLDEATSALDTESERQIQAALDHLMRGRTTIVIAHRLSTIRDADVIHVFNHGRVIESGSHASLLRDNGLYARLAALQFAADAVVPEAG